MLKRLLLVVLVDWWVEGERGVVKAPWDAVWEHGGRHELNAQVEQAVSPPDTDIIHLRASHGKPTTPVE